MAGNGRPLKLTPERAALILKHFEDGQRDIVAAALGGISERTFYTYLKLGRDAAEKQEQGLPLTEDEEMLLQFSQDVAHAKSVAEARNVRSVQVAAVPRMVQKRRTVQRPVLKDGVPQVDADGNVLYSTETTVFEEEVYDWHAASWWLERGRNWHAKTPEELDPYAEAEAIKAALQQIQETDYAEPSEGEA